MTLEEYYKDRRNEPEIYVVEDTMMDFGEIYLITTNKDKAEGDFLHRVEDSRYAPYMRLHVWQNGVQTMNAKVAYTWGIMGEKIPTIQYERVDG